jgi:type I restriction-modification system DNA methylase subunit
MSHSGNPLTETAARPQRGFLNPALVAELGDASRGRTDWRERLAAARAWASAYAENDIENTKEISLQATFLNRVFVNVLGYTDQGAGRSPWTLEAHPTTDVNARFPDGSLGFFSAQHPPVTRAVIELKDALTDLDAKQMSRVDRLSPVEQTFLYLASYEEARFAIVSNFRSLRLYARRYGMARYEEFDLTRIQESEELARLVGTCAAEMLLGDHPRQTGPLHELLSEHPPRPQREITAHFYGEYAVLRDRLVRYVVDAYPDLGIDAVRIVQKLLDRLLFIAYAEDVGLLPSAVLANTIDQGLRSRARSEYRGWDEVRFLIRDIDEGRGDLVPTINRYNGGLFARDRILDDQIAFPDSLVAEFKQLSAFDYKTEVDVNILGHVFENSIADIESLRRQLSLDQYAVSRDESAVDQQRRDLGIFYTPAWVTHFIVDQTLGRYLQEHGPEARHSAHILDPACGSGAFLSEALSYLVDYSRSLASTAFALGEARLFDKITVEQASDYLRQLYGIDLLAESVEISKLSLWLKSAARTEPLGTLDTIIEGNTVVRPDAPGGYAGTPVAQRIREGSFEVVVGNPPWGAMIGYELDPTLELARGQFDSYELFVERSLKALLAEGGYFGFIVPDRLLRPEGERLRRFLFDKFRVLSVIKVGEGVFPSVFRAAVIFIIQNAAPEEDDTYTGLILVKDDRGLLERQGAAQLATLVEQRGGAISRSRVVESQHYDIPLFADLDLEIVDRMDVGKVPWLGEGGVFNIYGRGEELGRASFVVQCPACYLWSVGPRKRAQRRGGGFEAKTCPDCGLSFTVEQALATRNPIVEPYQGGDSEFLPLLAGEDVNRYWIDPPSLGLELDVPGVDYKEPQLYGSPKLLIRQTSVGIYAAIDRNEESRCLQSVYVYRLREDEPIQLEFYLAQLASRAMLFRYYVLTNQVEWQSFPKLTHETLQRLPLHRPDPSVSGERTRHDSIVELVHQRELLASRDGHHGISKEALAVDQQIETLVMDLYGLNAEQRARINSRLKPQQNIRIVRELYPPADQLVNHSLQE